MAAKVKILVVSRAEAAAHAVAERIRGHGRFEVTTRAIANGHTDPLHDVRERPDLLLLHYVPGYGELEHLASLNSSERLELLVFGPPGDADAMRLAMRAGASDYLPEPLREEDLLHALERATEALAQKTGSSGSLLTILNSKGGSGASFVASNLACGLAQLESKSVTLVDLDLQFGSQSRYLDLAPKRGLAEALGAISEMDQVSAETFVTRHDSGLGLLAAPAGPLMQHNQVPVSQLDALLQVFLKSSDYVVADLPCYIDQFSRTVLERSDRILLVVQQSLAHLNCAARLLHVMCNELGLPRSCVDIVVNRHTKNAVIESKDIRKTLRVERLHVIPNQYKLVSDSIDTGRPVVENAKGSAVAKSLRELALKVGEAESDETGRGGFLGRTLPNFLGTH